MVILDISHQHVDITAEPDSLNARKPRVVVRNVEIDCLSVHFSPSDWVMLARSKFGNTPSVYTFTTEAAALEFLELAKENFPSFEWLQNPSEARHVDKR